MPVADLRPRISLDDAIVAENARLWAAHGRELWAVVKADGYGWGAARLASAVDAYAARFCVADAHEFFALRRVTQKPIVVFSAPAADDVIEILRAGGVPNIVESDALDAAIDAAQSMPARVRFGLAPALGWSGISVERASAFAARLALAERPPAVELWTYATSALDAQAQLAAFDTFVRIFEQAGVVVAGRDVEHSDSSSTQSAGPVRIGIGLFGGARDRRPGLRCALRLEAAVVAIDRATRGAVAGYARRAIPDGMVAGTLRLGYADGFPRGITGARLDVDGAPVSVVNVGMQYTVISGQADLREARLRLIDERTDLTAFCDGSSTTPHELVVSLGRSARAA